MAANGNGVKPVVTIVVSAATVLGIIGTLHFNAKSEITDQLKDLDFKATKMLEGLTRNESKLESVQLQIQQIREDHDAHEALPWHPGAAMEIGKLQMQLQGVNTRN